MRRQLIPHNEYQKLKIRSRGYLPHWEIKGATYSITHRLHDSLPVEVTRQLWLEKQAMERQVTGGIRALTVIERSRIGDAFAILLDDELHAERGACHLRDPKLAELVAGNLQYFNGRRYEPNHVHTVVRPFAGESLDEILHSWKSYTAHRATSIVRTRKLWAR
jgi:hypothetical protein